MSSGVEEHKADLKIAQVLKREGKVMEQMLAGQMALMGLNDRGTLLKKMRMKLRMRYGGVDAVTYGTTRYGMIKLHGIKAGTIVHRRNTRSYMLNEKASQDWWSPVADKIVPRMADKVAEIRADQALKESSVIGKLRSQQ